MGHLPSILLTALFLSSPAATQAPETEAEHFLRTGQCVQCDLSGADLNGIRVADGVTDDNLCTLNGIATGTFNGAQMAGADFTTCETKQDSRLSTMTWNGASLKEVDFSGARLGGNSFRDADLSGANLGNSTLYRVDLSGANLSHALLGGARSQRAQMSGAGSNFANADFTGASLKGAQLFGDFQGADFSDADLQGADISGFAAGARGADGETQLHTGPANFDGRVNLSGANLRNGSFFGQKIMSGGGFAGAILCRTTLPDGEVSNRDCQ